MSTTAEERRAAILNAIDDEPEYPGVMPDEMWYGLRNDRDATAEAMRVSVRLTKQNIRKRVVALLEGERGQPTCCAVHGVACTPEAPCSCCAARVPSESERTPHVQRRGAYRLRWVRDEGEPEGALSSVTEGSVENGSAKALAEELQPLPRSAGPHVPDTAGEVDVMPGGGGEDVSEERKCARCGQDAREPMHGNPLTWGHEFAPAERRTRGERRVTDVGIGGRAEEDAYGGWRLYRGDRRRANPQEERP
ncbi:MAG: hypothetical protein ABL993_02455 [Vicinamibacterales bacterium]